MPLHPLGSAEHKATPFPDTYFTMLVVIPLLSAFFLFFHLTELHATRWLWVSGCMQDSAHHVTILRTTGKFGLF
jgi:hypothetical protein